jgi:LacI family transcriptional regulator
MTIKTIAKLCGVSRGTVDRVLNNRGKVKPGTQARVLQAIEQLGYSKNMAGRALTVRKSAPVIGVVVSGLGNPFFVDVMAGIRRAEAELRDYGVTLSVRELPGYDPVAHLCAIDELAQGLSALVIHTVNAPALQLRINALAAAGVPTITLNSDVENCKRVCYVGSDYYAGGRTIAAIMDICTRGRARLGILTGVDGVLGHCQRLAGAVDYLADRAPGIQVTARAAIEDDSALALRRTADLLAAHPDIDTLFVVAAAVSDVCRAVIEAGREGRVRVFAFDNVPATVDMMRRGLIDVVVCQQPFRQGYEAVRAAFDIILSGKPAEPRRIIMENQIRILENMDVG